MSDLPVNRENRGPQVSNDSQGRYAVKTGRLPNGAWAVVVDPSPLVTGDSVVYISDSVGVGDITETTACQRTNSQVVHNTAGYTVTGMTGSGELREFLVTAHTYDARRTLDTIWVSPAAPAAGNATE